MKEREAAAKVGEARSARHSVGARMQVVGQLVRSSPTGWVSVLVGWICGGAGSGNVLWCSMFRLRHARCFVALSVVRPFMPAVADQNFRMRLILESRVALL